MKKTLNSGKRSSFHFVHGNWNGIEASSIFVAGITTTNNTESMQFSKTLIKKLVFPLTNMDAEDSKVKYIA